MARQSFELALVPAGKRCSRCGQTKPIEEFTLNRKRKGGRASWCKPCVSTYLKSGVKRKSRLKTTYGISVERYNAMLAAQRGVCAVCGHPPTVDQIGRKHLHVDHCHLSGEIRGLLCSACNTALGLLRDDPAVIVKLHNYLDAHLFRRALRGIR